MHLKGIGGKIVNACLRLWSDEKKVVALVRSLGLGPEDKVLDVGCGFGRYTKALVSLGLNVTGVDVSEAIIEKCRAENLPCMTTTEHDKTDATYRLILMSHVIEHLPPWDLLPFMDRYLDRLERGGYLIIATPLLHRGFYNDFDHVKPYSPVAIMLVFCEDEPQVQYRSRNRLELVDIWFRKRPLGRSDEPALSYKHNPFLALTNVFWALAFALSSGVVGKRDGWVGLFRKTGQRVSAGGRK